MDDMNGCMHGWNCFSIDREEDKDKGIFIITDVMHACNGGWMGG
jgi:hypothetical protein